MLNRSKVDAVISGMPYDVTTVNGAMPSTLDAFVGELVEIVVSSHGQTVEIRGCGRLVDEVVIVHEKDEDGTGSDVRLWSVAANDGGFVAVQNPG